jgi:hypothetical protein
MILSIAVLSEFGVIEETEIHENVTQALLRLPDQPHAYFERTPNSQLIPIDLLVASHVRSDGVLNANKLMKLAGQNAVAKRQPLTVRRFGDRYLVLDGNSTFVNAKYSDWTHVVCEIQQI